MSDRTRLVVLNSPGNPTGGVMPKVDLERIARLARERGIWVLSDEIYSRIRYTDGEVPSIASLPGMAERIIIVDGFSKTFVMTGWRLGHGIMPVALAERLSLLLVHAVGCTAHFTQHAGVEAFKGPQAEVDRVVAVYRERRDRLVAGLNSLRGVSCRKPEGAFYAFPNVKGTGLPCRELAARLLDEVGVALLPGSDFGQYGDGYLPAFLRHQPPEHRQGPRAHAGVPRASVVRRRDPAASTCRDRSMRKPRAGCAETGGPRGTRQSSKPRRIAAPDRLLRGLVPDLNERQDARPAPVAELSVVVVPRRPEAVIGLEDHFVNQSP